MSNSSYLIAHWMQQPPSPDHLGLFSGGMPGAAQHPQHEPQSPNERSINRQLGESFAALTENHLFGLVAFRTR